MVIAGIAGPDQMMHRNDDGCVELPHQQRGFVGVHVTPGAVDANHGHVRSLRFQLPESDIILGVAAVVDGPALGMQKNTHRVRHFPADNAGIMARRCVFDDYIGDRDLLAGSEGLNVLTRDAPVDGMGHRAGRHDERDGRVLFHNARDCSRIEVVFVPVGGNDNVRAHFLRQDRRREGAALVEHRLDAVGEIGIDVADRSAAGLENKPAAAEPPNGDLAVVHFALRNPFLKRIHSDTRRTASFRCKTSGRICVPRPGPNSKAM